MTSSEAIRADIAALEARQDELEGQAQAAADDAAAGTIGGMLVALGLKVKALNGKLAEALNLEAARERERQAKQAEKERQALIERCAALNADWHAWLLDFQKVDDLAAELWPRYDALRKVYDALLREVMARDMLSETGEYLTFGYKPAGSAAALAQAGAGQIRWRR